jgi:hypothetical protein
MSAEVAAVLAAHPSYSWVDKKGACSGSKVVCNGPDCTWEVDCDGHNGTTRRALFPAHFAEELAKVGIGSIVEARAEALRESMADKESPGALKA